jgi:preprotein translocase subunit SecG
MQTTLLIIQSILAVIITGSVLLQAQGSGLGTTWGGGGETYHTKRGVEKVVFYLTCISVALFTVVSLAVLVV